jgi:hypothetical protein
VRKQLSALHADATAGKCKLGKRLSDGRNVRYCATIDRLLMNKHESNE